MTAILCYISFPQSEKPALSFDAITTSAQDARTAFVQGNLSLRRPLPKTIVGYSLAAPTTLNISNGI